MINPFAALVAAPRKSVWDGPLGSLLSDYLREAGPGGAVSDEQALRILAVLSCVGLIAQNIGALPLPLYKRLPKGRAQVDATNSLVRLLAHPNGWQTGQDWREQMTAHLLLRGNGLSWIEWVRELAPDGSTRFRAQQLVPLPPDQMAITPLIRGDGRLGGRRYVLTTADGRAIELPADEVLHLPGLSWNGIAGRSVLADARDAFGVALATQAYAGRLFTNDATPGIVLEHPKTLTDGAARRLKEQWDADHAGQARKTAVLEEGMKVSRLSITPEDAQFLETRKFQRAEICGLFRVPPHLIGDVDRSTSWGTGIEQQAIGFVQFTLLPWLRKWEHTIGHALIIAEDQYYVEHTVEGFLRGDSATRGAFYTQMVTNGIYTRNEVRELENRNPLAGLDDPLTPANLSPGGAPAPGTP